MLKESVPLSLDWQLRRRHVVLQLEGDASPMQHRTPTRPIGCGADACHQSQAHVVEPRDQARLSIQTASLQPPISAHAPDYSHRAGNITTPATRACTTQTMIGVTLDEFNNTTGHLEMYPRNDVELNAMPSDVNFTPLIPHLSQPLQPVCPMVKAHERLAGVSANANTRMGKTWRNRFRKLSQTLIGFPVILMEPAHALHEGARVQKSGQQTCCNYIPSKLSHICAVVTDNTCSRSIQCIHINHDSHLAHLYTRMLRGP